MIIPSIKDRLIAKLGWLEKLIQADIRYLLSGNFWTSLGRIINIGGGIALTLTLANLIKPETYGAYKYILAIAGTVGAFSLAGTGTAAAKAAAQNHQNIIKPLFKMNFRWSIPASFISLAGSIYYLTQSNYPLGYGLLCIAITNPFFNGFILMKSLMVGKKDFKTLAIYNVPSHLITVVSMITTVLFTDHLIAILSAYFFSNLFTGWLFYTLATKKHLTPDHDLTTEEKTALKQAVNYSKHLSITGAFVQLTAKIDQLLLWHLVGPVQLAIYSFAQAPVNEIRNFSNNLFSIAFPKLAAKEISEAKKMLPLRLLQMAIPSVIIIICYIIAAPFLFRWLFPQYIGAVFASQLLVTATILQPTGLIDTLINAHGLIRKKYLTAIIPNIIKLISFAILIPMFGLMGAIVSLIIAEASSAIILIWIYFKL